MTEAEIQKQIIKYAEAKGCIVIRLNAGKSGRYNTRLCPPGTPDLLIVGKSYPLWVEIKGPAGKLRDSQIAMHDRLTKLNQTVIVANCLDDVSMYI